MNFGREQADDGREQCAGCGCDESEDNEMVVTVEGERWCEDCYQP